MYAIKVGVRQGSGGLLERHVANGGKVMLGQGERLVLFAPPENVEVTLGAHGEYTVRMKGGGELVVATAVSLPELAMPGSETKEPLIVFAPQAAVEEGDAHVAEPLSIHQASVADTGFLHRDVGGDFGLDQLLQMASFSAESGEGLSAGKSPGFQEWEAPAPVMNGDDGGEAGNVSPVADGPVDLGSMNEDGSLVITAAELLARASDLDGDTLSVTGLTVATGHGSLTDNGDGTWTFTPPADWNGSVSFDYTVSDGHGGTAPATASLSVDPVNDTPVADGPVDLGSMNEDGSLVITAAELLARASDLDGDTLSVTGLTVATGHGSLTDNGDGTWTFTPPADWNGSASFDYTVSDGHGGTAPATASLTVDPVNDAPVISVNDALLVDGLAAQSLAGSLAATDVDNGAADLGYTITQGPANGVLLLDGVEIADFSQPVFTQADIDSGRVAFRFDDPGAPQAQEKILVLEDDTFVFTVTDGLHATSPATFNIQNTTVQVWGTDESDDLTGAVHFDRGGVRFNIYGFDGNDTMRGGSGADTLDGGGHVFAAHTPWMYTQEGGDTVDYGASGAAVDIDLTRETQSGGHAEGDVLVGVENVIGSAHGDSIAGDAAANLLSGLAGDDTLLGMDGNDTLRGGAGTDLIDGGVGQDFADYRTSASWVAVDLNIQDGLTAQSGGGADNDALGDTLVGIENLIGSNDASHGDVLTGNAANNHLIGLDGDDTLIGNAGNDTFVGGVGADVLSGGVGTRDLADYSASTAWVNVDLTKQDGTTAQSGGGAGNHAEGDILTGIEDVNGSAYDDSILGNTVDNVIFSYGGNDTVFAGNGADTVHGGDGDDFIDGGARWDELYGNSGNDTVYGGNSIDTIWGGAGDDVLYGYRSDGGSDGNQDLLMGGTGNDTLVSLSTGRSTLIGCQGADRIMGSGVDEVSYEITDDYFTVNYGKSVYVDLRIQDGVTAQSGGEGGNDAVGDVLTGIRHIVGTYGMTGDTLIGNDDANEIYGMDGHDLIIGGGGNDILWGYDHNDTLEGGAGGDLLWGGMDHDMVSYEHASQGVGIDLRNQCNYAGQVGAPGGEENGDELWYVDGVIGSAHNDTLIGGSVGDEAFATPGWRAYREAANSLEGGAGDDLLMGLGAADTLDGGEGRDTADYSLSEDSVRVDLNLTTGQTGGGEVTETSSSIDGSNPGIFYGGNHARGDVLISIENVTGSAFHDTLVGNGEDNVLSGLDGNDSLIGGGGDDTLLGGADDDTVYGGAGNDVIGGGDGDDLLVGDMTDTINGGAGFDTFRLENNTGTGGLLDLTAMTGAGGVTNVEAVDITGDADDSNTLTLRASDVLDTTGGADTLWVHGDGSDTVTATDTGWTHVGVETGADGQQYNHYSGYAGSTLVNLMVDVDIAAQNIHS